MFVHQSKPIYQCRSLRQNSISGFISSDLANNTGLLLMYMHLRGLRPVSIPCLPVSDTSRNKLSGTLSDLSYFSMMAAVSASDIPLPLLTRVLCRLRLVTGYQGP